MSLLLSRCQCPPRQHGRLQIGTDINERRELQRIEVVSKGLERRMTVVSAAHVLDMTTRQVQRLLKTFQADGAAAPAADETPIQPVSLGLRPKAMIALVTFSLSGGEQPA